jgi:hypothetical protein
MSLVGDLGKGISGLLLLVGIAPLPVSLLVLVVSPYYPAIYYAIGAHIGFLAWVFLDNDSKRLREAQATTVSDYLSLFIRYYCAFYIGIALFFGSSASLYLIAPSNETLNAIGKWVVSIAGLLLFATLFSSKKTVDLTPPVSTEHIRGTQVKGGDDLPNYLPPPPGGIGE